MPLNKGNSMDVKVTYALRLSFQTQMYRHYQSSKVHPYLSREISGGGAAAPKRRVKVGYCDNVSVFLKYLSGGSIRE